MLRNKGLTDKVIILGLDGMDPRFSKAMIDEGKMPNLKKLVEMGAAREDLVMLGAMPTITPPLWATLATGCYPMTHGIIDYNIQVPGELDMTQEAFMSKFLKAEPLWNVTAHAGKKTWVWHWPGGAWPPTSDNPNLLVVDEVGYLPITSTEGNLFFQLISELQEQASIIITTNKGFEEWAEFLDDAALATAILDRLSYRCDRIQMSGKSYRLENRKSFLSKGDATDEI